MFYSSLTVTSTSASPGTTTLGRISTTSGKKQTREYLIYNNQNYLFFKQIHEFYCKNVFIRLTCKLLDCHIPTFNIFNFINPN